MAERLHFSLVSPERELFAGEVDQVDAPGSEGDFGVLAGHAPLISSLRPGVIEVKGGTSGDARFFVLGGFTEVTPNKLTVLAEDVRPMTEVDAAKLDQCIRDAQEDILHAPTESERAKAAESLDHLKLLRATL